MHAVYCRKPAACRQAHVFFFSPGANYRVLTPPFGPSQWRCQLPVSDASEKDIRFQATGVKNGAKSRRQNPVVFFRPCPILEPGL